MVFSRGIRMSITLQLIWLFTLAVPIACVAWTVTHEEVFREPREFCIKCSKEGRTLATRKFFYLFTCEYCFSHYITILFVALTDYKLLMDDWRGYLIGGFALVWIANIYMSLFARVRIDLKRERTEVSVLEKQQLNPAQNRPAPGDSSSTRLAGNGDIDTGGVRRHRHKGTTHPRRTPSE